MQPLWIALANRGQQVHVRHYIQAEWRETDQQRHALVKPARLSRLSSMLLLLLLLFAAAFHAVSHAVAGVEAVFQQLPVCCEAAGRVSGAGMHGGQPPLGHCRSNAGAVNLSWLEAGLRHVYGVE
jgi:hypothetical protein